MPPPPLRPESDPAPKSGKTPLRNRLDQCLEILAESKAGDYFQAFAAGFKAFREARRRREGRDADERD